MTTRAATLGLLLGLSLSIPTSTFAQDERDVDAALALRDEGRFDEALALLERLQREAPSAVAQGQIGLTLAMLERWTDAHRELSGAIARGGPWIEENRERLDVAMRAIEQHVARLVVDGAPPGARLFVDGEDRGALPLDGPLGLSPGARRLRVTHAGHAPLETTLRLRAGEVRDLDATLAPTAARATDGDATGGGTTGDAIDPTPWLLVGAGAAVAIGGAVLVGYGQSEVGAVNEPPPGASWMDFSDRADTALTLSTTGVVLLSVGLAVSVAGVLWALFAP